MQKAILGSGLVVGLVLVAAGGLPQRNLVLGQPPQQVAVRQSGELIALSFDSEQGFQQVTVIEPRTRVMSVYHIEPGTAAITLKSVRNIDADLRMDEFNTQSPLPREIRAMLTDR